MSTKHNAYFFAKEAFEYSTTCTPEENQRRQENGRKPNVSIEFAQVEPEVSDAIFQDTSDDTDTEYQPTRWGGYLGAYA